MPEFAHEFPLAQRADERLRAALAAVRRRALPRHRQGPRRRPLDARRGRRAQASARSHGLSKEDRELVEFLVERHLAMSHVAQKQDVHDPDVIRAFADLVGTERRLVALYLFTVADVRGTSPKVWNAWKGKAARGPVPRHAAHPHRRAAGARRRAGREAGRSRAPAAPVRALGQRQGQALGAASTPPTSCATTRRRSPGRRATCTTASTPTSRWSRRASRRSARACR